MRWAWLPFRIHGNSNAAIGPLVIAGAGLFLAAEESTLVRPA
jgi:hypothetical protein